MAIAEGRRQCVCSVEEKVCNSSKRTFFSDFEKKALENVKRSN